MVRSNNDVLIPTVGFLQYAKPKSDNSHDFGLYVKTLLLHEYVSLGVAGFLLFWGDRNGRDRNKI